MIYGIIIGVAFLITLSASSIIALKQNKKIKKTTKQLLKERKVKALNDEKNIQFKQQQIIETQKRYLQSKVASIERNNLIEEYRKEVFQYIQKQHENPFEYEEEDYNEGEEEA